MCRPAAGHCRRGVPGVPGRSRQKILEGFNPIVPRLGEMVSPERFEGDSLDQEESDSRPILLGHVPGRAL